MSLPPPAHNQAYFTVSALEAGHVYLDFVMYLENATSNDRHKVPALAFLLQHSSNKKKFLFDLGIRRDWDKYPRIIKDWIKTVYEVEVVQDVVDSLAKGNVSPLDIDTLCLSHTHFDHIGNTAPFTGCEFVLGGDTQKLLKMGFYPENPDSPIAADLLPADRTRFLGDDLNWQPIGPFPRAYDFYGDGSLYIVDAPGHILGHINLLIRTSADGGWLYLAADTAHHWNLITGESAIAVGHPGHGPHGCAHVNKEQAEQSMQRVRELMKLPRVQVILAHDGPWYAKNKDGPAFLPGKIESL